MHTNLKMHINSGLQTSENHRKPHAICLVWPKIQLVVGKCNRIFASFDYFNNKPALFSRVGYQYRITDFAMKRTSILIYNNFLSGSNNLPR